MNRDVSDSTYKEQVRKIRRSARTKPFSFIFTMLMIILIGIALLYIIRKLPLKYRQYRAEKAYMALLEQSQYNWDEIHDSETIVDASTLKYSIVYLDDDSIPVLFLSMHSVGAPYGASGHTRMIIFNEETKQCEQIEAGGNCVGIVGYIKADENDSYPLVFEYGGRQDILFEHIYEFTGSGLVEVGRMVDLPYHNSDEIDTSITPNADEYYWNGESVSINEYMTEREAVINDYCDIDWIDPVAE